MVGFIDVTAAGNDLSGMGTLISSSRLETGRPWPLGATADANGINFALFSANAERVELCLFVDGQTTTLPLPACTDQVWHGYLPGATAGLCYAYRVFGPEGAGHRFATKHLLVDPYARDLTGVFSYGHSYAHEKALRASVTRSDFDWGEDAPPAVPLADSILYEVHVKGATKRHPGVPENLRGTYAGLASPAMIAHLKKVGATAVNLLPVQCFLDEERLVHSGKANYWGYNTLAFFAPEPRYAARIGGQSVIDEFKSMVKTLHGAGIEVILDVVYNHTAETDEFGPVVSFRGIDNASYYRLAADDPNRYENFSGCGNTLNLAHPRVLQLVMDSLRYWVSEMHVDGFRFDLAVALTRDSGFLAAIAQDPVLARVKLIAEPWDLGPDGYRLGAFPPGWSEWNDRFRDDVRAFWLTGDVGVSALAQRIAGSSELFRHHGRAPQASINFITAHDGFTLHDLVSYRDKHNELNGEQNRDGHGHNLSSNCGVEGETHDPRIRQTRAALQRAILAILYLAQGVPMLQGGDELGRTQSGNNNAYCQDNPLTWFDWQNADHELISYVSGLATLRRRFPQLRRINWLTGAAGKSGLRDVTWWHPDGREMMEHDWHAGHQGAIGIYLAATSERDGMQGHHLLVLVNRSFDSIGFALPAGAWQQLIDSASRTPFSLQARHGHSLVAPQSVQILLQEHEQ